ncbi:MAG TPA: metallophosphoesterase [Pirellulaceae bacterium]|nr:metallophosphoesterase [Pirellulaceae bacterium]
MSVAFRFLHVSDLHLGEPIVGVREPNEALREQLLSAPYAAAETAFDVAVREQVDFVLLTGNALDLHQPSPKPLSFLQKQFRRLKTEGIEVYWCSGATDPLERWPRALELPESVTTFATPGIEVVKIQNDKGALCTLLAAGNAPSVGGEDQPTIRAIDFRAISDTGFVIGAVHGRIDLDTLDELPCHYWALGGRSQRKAVSKGNRLAVYAGTCQSRSSRHLGACGANLVSVDPNRSLHSKEVACDRLRFLRQTLDADSGKIERLKELFSERMLQLASDEEQLWTVVDWTVTTESSGPGGFPTESQQQALIGWMRKEFAGRNSGVWCNRIDVQVRADRIAKGVLEEDSILGDFLRSLPEWEQDTTRELDLSGFRRLSTELQGAGIAERLDAFDRAELLGRVRRAGIELLGGSGG